ncbi:MAG: AsmA family protein [Halopseudomonas sp.]
MKLLLKMVLGLVLLAVLAIGALLVLVDPNDFKPELESLARDKGQVDLRLKGDIGWSLFPSIALSLPALEAMTLEGKPLASLQRAEIEVRLLPLLGGELKMKGLLLDGLKLDLTAPDPAAIPTPVEPDAVAGDAPKAAGALLFDIGRIQISNAQIRYADPAQAQVVELKDFNLSAEDLVSGQHFPLAVDFELALFSGEQTQPQLVAKSQLQAELLLDLTRQVFAAKGLQAQLSLAGASVAKPLELSLSADVTADQASDSVEIKELKLALANLLLNADLKLETVTDQPLITGTLQIPEFDLKQLLGTLGQPELLTRDDAALRKLGLEASLVGPAGVIGLEQLVLSVDQSRFTGSLSYALQSGAQVVKLAGDAIDVDRYLPPESQSNDSSDEVTPQDTSAERYSKAPLLPVELLQTLNIDADLALAEFKASGLTIEQLKLLLKADGGLVEVSQISGQLYQGSFENSATIDARQQPVRFDIKKQVSGIELGAMLVDLAEVDRFNGLFSMQGEYQAQGNSVYDIVHSLDGAMQLGLKQGRLKGVNLGDTLCRGILQAKGQQPPVESAQAYTEFTNLSATAKITDGVVVNNDLKAALVGINLAGDGRVDLPKEALNYGVSLTVLQEFASDNCRIDEKLHNLALPLRCEGGFDTDPAKLCGIDKARIKKVMSELGTREVKQKLEQKLEEELKGNESLKGVLKGLF